MCIKIVGPENSLEFNPTEPLEDQIVGASEIIVKYESFEERKINSFVREIERLALTGISCKPEIKVNANNDLNGIRIERHLENLKKKLEINEVVKGLCNIHANVDKKLCELSEMCLGKINE